MIEVADLSKRFGKTQATQLLYVTTMVAWLSVVPIALLT